MLTRTSTTSPGDLRPLSWTHGWDGICDECCEPIGISELHYLWSWPRYTLHMHVRCYMRWIDKQRVDLARAMEEAPSE